MDSVAIDLFSLPEVTIKGQKFDTIALCVDRESGWMVATPHAAKGLTAEKVARDMFHQRDIFGGAFRGKFRLGVSLHWGLVADHLCGPWGTYGLWPGLPSSGKW